MTHGDGSEADPGPDWSARIRLIVLTDRDLAAPRSVIDTVGAALAAGARAVQLRDKSTSVGALLSEARALRDLTRRYDALLFINDRLDLAIAVDADGVHLGPDDMPVSAVRAASPEGLLIGFSTDDPVIARAAEDAGADYLGCGTVYPTATKPDAGDVIGLAGLDAVARAVSIPVVGIGGIDATRSAEVARKTTAAGVAVVGAVMSAEDPGQTVREILSAWEMERSPGP